MARKKISVTHKGKRKNHSDSESENEHASDDDVDASNDDDTEQQHNDNDDNDDECLHEITLNSPSCAVLAIKRPSRENTLPRVNPRAPDALGLSVEYSSQSSTRTLR